MWRALALKHGLDPDTPVEDILLLEENKEGKLIVAEKAERAAKALEYVHRQNHKQTGDSIPGK